MKSFADWTDEIRALMNPPAPMADTCNLAPTSQNTHLWECTPKGTIKWHTDAELLRRGIKVDPKWLERSADRYRKELLGEFKMDPAEPGGDMTASAIAHRHDGRTVFSCGRRTDKTVMQNEWHKRAMDFLASQDYSKLEERVIQNGQVLWGITGKGDGPTMVIYDEYTTFDPELFGTIKIDGKIK